MSFVHVILSIRKQTMWQRFKMLMCIKIALFPIIHQNLHAETNDSLASSLHWWFTCGVCDIKQQNIHFSISLPCSLIRPGAGHQLKLLSEEGNKFQYFLCYSFWEVSALIEYLSVTGWQFVKAGTLNFTKTCQQKEKSNSSQKPTQVCSWQHGSSAQHPLNDEMNTNHTSNPSTSKPRGKNNT